MPITIARLRQVILILAGLLVAVLIGFFAYARYRFRHFERDLPARLGINIQQTANGYTYSQSSKGHTLFTVHASKLIQYKQGGNATLHDVSVTLYGPAGSNRIDRISGSDFDYDQKDKVIRAQGPVSIDLQGFGTQSADQQNRVHVTTSGLVFDQKTGQADTSQHTEFQFPKASGSSTGAHYNSKTGVLVLDTQVELTTDTNGNTAVIHASHAQIVRDTNQGFFLNLHADYRGDKGSADSAIVYFRPDGSAQSMDAEGHVRIVTDDGAIVTASNSLTQFDDKSQPIKIDLNGGVNFDSKTEGESMHGTASSGTLTFAGNSMLKHAQFRNDVSFVDQVLKLANDPNGTASREMQAEKVDVDFVPGPDGKSAIAQKALAVGNAKVNLHTVPSKGTPQTTTISGDQLLALLTPDGRAIRQLNGSGNTKIVDVAKDGSTNTSSGDHLQVIFNVVPAKSKQQKRNASQTTQASQIETAIQDGHVVLTQTPQKKPGAPEPTSLTAWAQHSEYHASDQVLRLTGAPRLLQGKVLQMAATIINYHRDSGDAAASGNVKAIYAQQSAQNGAQTAGGPTLGGDGPVHITADHALLRRSTNVSTFYGSASADARMWQGVNSILAPVIELTRTPQTLKAYGAPGSHGPVVNANLTSAMGAKHQQSTVRIHSSTLFYSDADRRGDFRGEVTAASPDGVIHGDEAEIYLTPAAKQVDGKKQSQQAELQRIVATGHIVITQPGRRGVGEKLVYTSDDGRYVLTGSPGHPPYLEDAVKGRTTGATLIFNSQDDSVVVSGGQSSAVTVTRTPK